MINVDKGIKPPKNNRGRRSTYPWASLKVGDSFFIPDYTSSPYSMVRSYNNYSGKTAIKITTKKENGGIRIWRVK